jgi:hypothetical protein
MSLKQRLRTCLCCLVLEMGALTGVPMRPEQIQDLMHALNRPKVAQTDPEQDMQGADRPRNPQRPIE